MNDPLTLASVPALDSESKITPLRTLLLHTTSLTVAAMDEAMDSKTRLTAGATCNGWAIHLGEFQTLASNVHSTLPHHKLGCRIHFAYLLAAVEFYSSGSMRVHSIANNTVAPSPLS
jgi:hypothetical protein